MKAFIKHYSLLVILVTAFSISNTIAQDINNIPEGKYLVIGSFKVKSNALGFTDYVRKMDKYDVELAYHPPTSFYHVYIKQYQGSDNGYKDVWQLRNDTEFNDTWFMIVKPYDSGIKDEPVAANPTVEQPTPVAKSPTHETTEPVQKKEEVIAKQKPLTETQDPNVKVLPVVKEDEPTKETEPAKEEWVKVSETDTENITPPATTTPNIETAGTGIVGANITLNQPNIVPKTYTEEGKYKIFCNTYYTKNYSEIRGNVDIINPKTSKLIRTAKSLELLHVKDPNNGEHAIQLIANIFGYKKVQHDFDLTNPFDSITAEFMYFVGDTLVANFPLRRYDQGDIATMYNVFFFKDAAIMKPNSIYELNSLLEMLKENDELKIRIHGHTNSNERGKIITLTENATDFFTLNQELTEEYGTAKELSLRRSEVIRNFLISENIAANRMEVIGWGGKRPIYHKMDKLAIKNVRVEIEILEN